MLVKTFITATCTVVVAAVVSVLVLPMWREYHAAASSRQYRKAVISEAFASYEKARPQRRARQRGQEMMVKPQTAPEPNTTEPLTPFPSVFGYVDQSNAQ